MDFSLPSIFQLLHDQVSPLNHEKDITINFSFREGYEPWQSKVRSSTALHRALLVLLHPSLLMKGSNKYLEGSKDSEERKTAPKLIICHIFSDLPLLSGAVDSEASE